MELISKRNSIIIEPNLPVILSKVVGVKEDEKGKYFGVFEDVTVFHIVKYLMNDKFEFKKILTTPESYNKVINALKNLNIDYHNGYFLLFDECDKLSREVVFRDNILIPMDDFFNYKHKALISATAIMPSDPRYKKHNFEYHVITPSYNYLKELHFFETNNPKEMLQEYIATLSKEEDEAPYFIFFNSVKGIVSCIEDLNISHESSLFTSESGKKSLINDSTIKSNTYVNFYINKLSKYNFMTSRYYDAFDIHLSSEKKPHVIMITDLNRAIHTMLDPKSDMIQIPGRFRKGLASLAFISNFSNKLYYKTPEEVDYEMRVYRECYQQVLTFRNTCKDVVSKEAYNSMLNHMPFRKYIKSENEMNYYMVDAFFEEERIKSYYKSYENMSNCFNSMSETFTVNYKKVNFLTESKYHNISDMKGLFEQIKEIVDDLDIILNCTSSN